MQDRNKTYLVYSGIGLSSDSAANAATLSSYMKNMGFMEVYYMTPQTTYDWVNAGYPLM